MGSEIYKEQTFHTYSIHYVHTNTDTYLYRLYFYSLLIHFYHLLIPFTYNFYCFYYFDYIWGAGGERGQRLATYTQNKPSTLTPFSTSTPIQTHTASVIHAEVTFYTYSIHYVHTNTPT